jgi:pSer/pThr/pTyr-binding forkhead associated (FHA) protein/tetratricopeptide (TPR) repeat protein
VLKLIIEDDEGRKTVVPFVREEITIGRQEGNTIRLTERNVSRRHARLLRQNGHVVVEDLGSSNGTRINGERISGQSAIKDGDLIQIGDYDLALQSEAAAAAAASRAAARPAPAAEEEDSDPDASASEPETETETPVHEEAAANGASGDQRRHSTAIIHMDAVENTRSRKVKNLGEDEAPRLVVVSAELKGQEFACIRTEMRIGRTDDNDIVIDHRSLSRTHAKIVREDNGEWRIMDMQSANGMKINGESYAQASLSSGDIVELGHVKLKFVPAGEAVGALAAGGRSKLPLVAALLVLLLGGGGGAFYFLVLRQPPPPEIVTTDPPKQPDPPEQVQPPEPKPPVPDETAPETPKPDETAEATAQAKDLQARIGAAETALAQGKLDKAEDALNPLKKADGSWPSEVKQLASRIADEKQVLLALNEAQKAIEAQKLDEAEQQLSNAEITSVFVDRHKQLRASLEAVRKAATKEEPPKVVEPPKPPPTKTATPGAEEQAGAAYADALNLFRAKQHHDARIMAEKCIALTPKDGRCHKLLGAIHATLKDLDKAAKHYREFLKLAPKDPSAARVQELLNEYDKYDKQPK